jgi:hypothetical protein
MRDHLAHRYFDTTHAILQDANANASEDEAAKVRDSRFVIAQMLAAAGRPDEALTELAAVRPLLVDAFGADSTQIRNLDKQIDRLRTTNGPD